MGGDTFISHIHYITFTATVIHQFLMFYNDNVLFVPHRLLSSLLLCD